MLSKGAKRFADYATSIFVLYIFRRLGVVWDRYVPKRLKRSAKDNRGRGSRRHTTGTSPLPANWADFICMRRWENDRPFSFHSITYFSSYWGKIMVTTYDTHVFCTNKDQDISELEPCEHEEADSRLTIVHTCCGLCEAWVQECSYRHIRSCTVCCICSSLR